MNTWKWLAVALLTAGVCRAEPVVIDHRHTDITALTQARIERAKAVLHIAYGHTSHGSQLTDGMSGLVGFANGGGKGLSLPENLFAWNNGGTGGALDLHDYAMGGDVGYYPQWVQNTTNYLNNPANADVNVIIWSWCGQMDDKCSAGTLTNEYLAPMAALEAAYPDVVFVYMTGHVDIWDDADNKAACEAIRLWCSAGNRVLYDFNDIEHWDPDGTYYEFVNDDCSVYGGPGGAATGNWATEWQDSHVQNTDWYSCGSAHSEPLNANQKGYAAWALWCALAEDLDRDGITDRDEYVADSCPTNPGLPFAIEGLLEDDGAGAVVASSAGRMYSLSVSTDLVDGGWTTVTSRMGTGTTLSLVDENPAQGLNAYRVGVAVPE